MAYRIAQEPHNKRNLYRKITTDQQSMEKKTHKNEGEKNVEKVWRETATEIEEKKKGGKHTEYADGLDLNCASQTWLSPFGTPPNP